MYFILYREVKRIIKLYDHLKKDYEEISDKYAEIIGHQNPKQRIKHVTHLKEKNYHLEQVRSDRFSVAFAFLITLFAVILMYNYLI